MTEEMGTATAEEAAETQEAVQDPQETEEEAVAEESTHALLLSSAERVQDNLLATDQEAVAQQAGLEDTETSVFQERDSDIRMSRRISCAPRSDKLNNS